MKDEIPRYKLDFEDNGSFIMIQGGNFVLEPDLSEKLIENMKKNIGIFLSKCKNCEKPFIRNSSTHVICWRCREKDRLETEAQEL